MDWSLPKFPLDDICDDALNWLTVQLSPITRPFSKILAGWIDASTAALNTVPPVITIAVAALIAWRIAGTRVAILTAAGLAFLLDLRLWDATVQSLVLVLISTAVALAIGVPLGIACALSRRTWQVVSPVLDMGQTLPSFVYLIPAIPFFGLGPVSAAFATIVFAMPPTIRMTALGIMQVPAELVEASDAFGSTTWQKLAKVQLPLATPTILAGVNQTIMLALSMVVIAAMIGAGGLGGEVWKAIQRLEAGRGFEAGIAIVILAIILDRITQRMARRAHAA